MSSKFTLPELLEVVKEAYECVEVRTIAAPLDGRTYNVVTLIQFSTSLPAECEEEMHSRLKGNYLCDGGPLRFAWQCLPATRWLELAAQLAAGELRVDGLTASLGAAVELKAFSSHIDQDFGYIRNPTAYPMFQDRVSTFPGGVSTEQGRRLERIVFNEAVLGQLRRSGFQWFIELASAYLGAIPNDPAEPSLVVVVAPVPAMADRIEVNPGDHQIRAYVRSHPKIASKLRLMGDVLAGSTPLWSKPKGKLIFGQLESCGEDDLTYYADAACGFGPASLDDYAELRVVHETLEIVNSLRFSLCVKSDLENRGTRVAGGTLEVQQDLAASAHAAANRYTLMADSRIAELRALSSAQFDFRKLVRLCEELNIAFQEECYFATAMLTRCLLDHVPPIFGKTTFSEVANNYSAGGKSFKEAMHHLESAARKVADAHLHMIIRKSETLPTAQQVNFSSQLDVLLSEIVRIS